MKNGKLFKKIFISIVSVLMANITYANNYIMLAPDNITKIECANNNVLNMHILSTLTNEKKSVIVVPAGSGETNFAIYMKNKKCDFKATVNGDNLTIKGDKTIKILPLDLPPELVNSEEKNK